MAFTRTEKLHLFIAKLSALPHPCVKRSFFFHRNIPFTYPKGGGVKTDRLRSIFPAPYDKNRLSMTIPASVPVALASHGFFPYIRTDI